MWVFSCPSKLPFVLNIFPQIRQMNFSFGLKSESKLVLLVSFNKLYLVEWTALMWFLINCFVFVLCPQKSHLKRSSMGISAWPKYSCFFKYPSSEKHLKHFEQKNFALLSKIVNGNFVRNTFHSRFSLLWWWSLGWSDLKVFTASFSFAWLSIDWITGDCISIFKFKRFRFDLILKINFASNWVHWNYFVESRKV